MAITVTSAVARATPGASSTSTITTGSFTPAVGEWLVVCGSADVTTSFTPTLTDSQSGSWGSAIVTSNGGNDPAFNGGSWIYSRPVASATSMTITWAVATSAFLVSVKVYRVSATGALSIGATGHGTSTTQNATITAFTSTANNSVLMVDAFNFSATVTTTSSDLTIDAWTVNTGIDNVDFASGFKTLGAPGSQTFNANSGAASPQWHWCAFEIVEASSGGGPYKPVYAHLNRTGPMALREQRHFVQQFLPDNPAPIPPFISLPAFRPIRRILKAPARLATPVPPQQVPIPPAAPPPGHSRRFVLRRAATSRTPVPPQFNPPYQWAPVPARRRRVFLKRATAPPPVPAQVFAGPPPAIPPVHQRIRRFILRRATTSRFPVQPQVFAGPPPAIAPVYSRIRRLVLARKASAAKPVPAQVAPPFVPAAPARAPRRIFPRRPAAPLPTPAQASPPAPAPTPRRPRVQMRRASAQFPVQPQLNPIFIIPAVQRARRFVLRRRATAPPPVPVQVFAGPLPVFPAVYQRIRRLVLKRTTTSRQPVQAQQPTSPSIPQALARRVRGFVRPGRPTSRYAPLDQAGSPVPASRRRLVFPFRRRPVVAPVPAQGAAAPSSAQPTRRRWAALRRRTLSPAPQAPAPAPPTSPSLHVPTHPRPGVPRTRLSGPPMPPTVPPPPGGRGGQPRRPVPPPTVQRRRTASSDTNFVQPPKYVSFLAPRLRRVTTLARRAFAKIPVFGGLAPVRDIRFDFVELDPSWQFRDLTPVWTFKELTSAWRFTEPPIGWTFDELSASWTFTEPPLRG